MANLKNNLKKPFWLSLAPKEKVIFAQHLASMLDAGIPLHEALSVLKDQIAQPSLKYVIDVALIDLADGLPLHVSFGKFPKLREKPDPYRKNRLSPFSDAQKANLNNSICLLYTSPSPRDS